MLKKNSMHHASHKEMKEAAQNLNSSTRANVAIVATLKWYRVSKREHKGKERGVEVLHEGTRKKLQLYGTRNDESSKRTAGQVFKKMVRGMKKWQ
jgi:hypothetical protein